MKKIFNKKTVYFIVSLALVAWYLYQSQYQNQTVTTAPTSSVQSATSVTTSSGDYFDVYFTNPPLDSSSQGIETHLIGLINNAKQSVHGVVYEIDLQNVADALISAKQRGIEVQLVYDDEQADKPERQEILEQFGKVGIPFVPDERSAYMHNKFFVIDGKIVWTGSFNITNNASHKNNENAVVFESAKLAENYEKEFSEMFNDNLFGPKSTSDTPNPTTYIGEVEINNYFAPEDKVMPKIITEVKKAKYSIDFLSFSFTDVDLGYTISELALNDDVIVRGVFDANQNMENSVCPYLMARDKNIEGNGDILVKLDGNKGIMHEKVIVIDGVTVIFGSFNFSGQANTSNDENILVVHDPALAALFLAEFQKIFDQGITPLEGCKKN